VSHSLPRKAEDTRTFKSSWRAQISFFTLGPPPTGVRPALLAHRLNCVLDISLARSGLFNCLPHPLPEGSKSRAPIMVLYVALYERAHDIAGTFSLLSCQILEVVLQVVVDPNGQLGHGTRRGSRLKGAQHVLHVVRKVGPFVLSASLHCLVRRSGLSPQEPRTFLSVNAGGTLELHVLHAGRRLRKVLIQHRAALRF